MVCMILTFTCLPSWINITIKKEQMKYKSIYWVKQSASSKYYSIAYLRNSTCTKCPSYTHILSFKRFTVELCVQLLARSSTLICRCSYTEYIYSYIHTYIQHHRETSPPQPFTKLSDTFIMSIQSLARGGWL